MDPMMPAGAPRLTLDKINGLPVAQWPDGTILPINMATPSYGSAQNASSTDAGTSGPGQQTPSTDLPEGVGVGESWGSGTPGGDSGLPGMGGPSGAGGADQPGYGAAIPEPGAALLQPGVDPAGGETGEPSAYGPAHTVAPRNYTPRPNYQSWVRSDGVGGGGSPPNLKSSIASARGRLQSGLAQAKARLSAAGIGGGGGGSSGGYGGGSSTSTSSQAPDYPRKLRGRFAGGMDANQAAGFALRPSGMIPIAAPGLNPTSPEYGRIADLPLWQMALLSGGTKGKLQGTVNNLGQVVKNVARSGELPGTGQMFNQLANGKAVDAIFKGEKAGKGDTESYTVPGYEYGKEPLLMGEATESFAPLLDTALYNEPLSVQAKYGSEGWGGYLMDRWAAKASHRKPGRGPEVNEFVTRRLFR